MTLNKHQLFLLLGLIVVAITIPVAVFYQQYQTRSKSEALKSTTLYFQPTTSSTPITTSSNSVVNLDVMVNPGSNIVSGVKVVLNFDSNKLSYNGSNAFTANSQNFSETIEGPIYGTNQLSTTLSIGSDYTKAITTPTKVGTVSFKVKSTSPLGSTQVGFASSSAVTSIASTDESTENVIAQTTPANLNIATEVCALPNPPAGSEYYETTLYGSNVVPPTASTATGRAVVVVGVPVSSTVQVSFCYAGLSNINNDAGIHFGTTTQNTPETLNLPASAATSDTETNFTISVVPSWVTELRSGKWYIKISSLNFPNGEIRGQFAAGSGSINPTPTSTLPTNTPSPTPIACNTSGGSGGSATGGSGINVRGGDGGVGGISGGVCKPGTNGYNVNASNYCSGNAVAISWPTTNTATYYKLLIDNVQVYNGPNLSFTAANYSLGARHNIVLYAGNSQIGDFNPSTGGYFEIISPSCSPTSAPTPFSSPTPTKTPTPTITPTSTPIPATPTFSPTPTPLPTNTPVPTSTPVPASTLMNIALNLPGIGNYGDARNPGGSSLSNKNPIRSQRDVVVYIYNPITNAPILSTLRSVTYNSSTGDFRGIIGVGNTLPTGTYEVKVKSDSYLTKSLGNHILNQGSTITIPKVNLEAGDLTGNNTLDILDYMVLYNCYSDLQPARSCTPAQKSISDLTDDGSVNQFDLNLLLREWSVKSGD